MLTETGNESHRSSNNTSASPLRFSALCGAMVRGLARVIPFPIPRTTAGRRRLIAVFVGAALTAPALCALTGSVLPVVLFAPILSVLVIALGLSVDMITDRPTSSLDERERRVRDSALSRPLEVGIVAGVAIGFLAQWTFGNDDPAAVALLMTVTMLAFSMRLMAIAWTMPDSVGDE